ncbi:hypothetical protein PWT90_02590 [Aphanocladium album]|nr:hypothetical protein PWT90_02590 [Aphanocladium album]
MSSHTFDTIDGHNPEIIYHLLDHQAEFTRPMGFNQLDRFLRVRGLSRQTRLLQEDRQEQEAREYEQALDNLAGLSYDYFNSTQPHAEDLEVSDDWPLSSDGSEDGIYFENAFARNEQLMKRLDSRTSSDLATDTDDLFRGDHMHGVHLICDAHTIVRFMVGPNGERHIFSEENDLFLNHCQARGESLPLMPAGPFKVKYENPFKPDDRTEQQVVLRHIYLPGWQGTPSEDVLKPEAWDRGIRLARGRRDMQSMYREGEPRGLPDVIENLGFPDVLTFAEFINRPDIKAAFCELWDVALGHVSSAVELPNTEPDRRPAALRIFYSRTLNGRSEFDESSPNKAGWGMSSHLARFCLQVEKVCDRELLPPMRGQIPVLPGKVSVAVVAWGGIELARILRRMQKGSRARYLD